VLVSTARTRELIEDKDRTKELHDAITQGTDSYGMQSFDQSLMMLLRAGQISYDEALRQASNPDDFALRVSGIGATSDSKWDSFEGGSRPIPGQAAFGASTQPAPAQVPAHTPSHAAPRPMAQAPQAPVAPRIPTAPAPRPVAPAPAAPAAQPAKSEASDDPGFEIERF